MQKIIQDYSIGRNIRRLRKLNKLTQLELAAQMQTFGSSVSNATLAKIEGGYRNIYVSDIVILKTILNVDFNEFFVDLSI